MAKEPNKVDSELVERLNEMAADLPEKSPAAINYREAAASLSQLQQRIVEVEAERDEARTLVAEANNSLYGSQGYFHSTDGGPFNKYHLAQPIEDLKASANREWRRAEAAEAALAACRQRP